MAFLIDTNVVSEARKRDRCNAGVRRWLGAVNDHELFLSVLVVGEIRHGVELVRRRDTEGAKVLDRWLRDLEKRYGEHLLPITLEICDRWGKLGLERPLAPVDGLMAATALHHGLVLVTRNVAHVESSGVEVLNPFDA